MNVLISLTLLIVLFNFDIIQISAQENEVSDESSIASRSYDTERTCRYRRQPGICRRRSECNRPTRRTCRFGSYPTVCCLDQHEPKTTSTTTTTTTITTTTRQPATTKKSTAELSSTPEIDLTFPGCGFRSPKIQESNTGNNARPVNDRRSANNRRRGWFRGKRAILGGRRGAQPVVVGGTTAAENSWPWMVAVFKKTGFRTPDRFLCGASLISRKYVLTAAHCFDGENGNIDPSKYFIYVGSHTTKDGIEYPVQKILIHPNYRKGQYYNDMSLLEIRNSVELTKKIYPVCLPSDSLRNKIQVGNDNVTVTGWGDTSFRGVNSKYLQELTIPIVPLKECNDSYSKLSRRIFEKGITKLMICAGVKEGGKDACKGDSGGPLVSKLKDNSYVQLGIVSFGFRCALPGFPGVYTRVSQYTKWIYDNTDLGKV